MKHLVDEREPITVAEIDKAIEDATRWLEEFPGYNLTPGTTGNLIARLTAIVADTYGYEPTGDET